MENNQDSVITPGVVPLDLKNSVLKWTLATGPTQSPKMTGVVATGLKVQGAISSFSKGPGENIHATSNIQGKEELFVFLFDYWCFAYNDIGSILCRER